MTNSTERTENDAAIARLLRQQQNLMEMISSGANLQAPCRRAVQAKDEILLRIFQNLSLRDQKQICLVNKRWCKLAQSDVVWQKLFESEYSGVAGVTSPGYGEDWRTFYRKTKEMLRLWLSSKTKSIVLGEATKSGHQAKVTCACVHGQRAATGSEDFSVLLWDLTTGEKIRKFRGHTLTVTALVMDASRLLSASEDGGIRVWHLKNGMCLSTVFVHSKAIVSVGMAGDYLMSASLDATVLLFNKSDASQTHQLKGHRQDVRCTHFSLDERDSRPVLVSGSSDQTIRVWSLATSSAKNVLRGHTGTITAIDRTGDILFSASVDKTVRLWNRITGSSLYIIQCNDPVESLNCDNQKILVGLRTGTISVISRSKYNVINTIGKARKPIKFLHTIGDKVIVLAPGERDNPSLRVHTVQPSRGFSSAAMSLIVVNRLKQGSKRKKKVPIEKAKSFNGPIGLEQGSPGKAQSTERLLVPGRTSAALEDKPILPKSRSVADIPLESRDGSALETTNAPTSIVATPPSGPKPRGGRPRPIGSPASQSEARPGRTLRRNRTTIGIAGHPQIEKTPATRPIHSERTLHLLQEARSFLDHPVASQKVRDLAAMAKQQLHPRGDPEKIEFTVSSAPAPRANGYARARELSGLLAPTGDPYRDPKGDKDVTFPTRMKQSKSMLALSRLSEPAPRPAPKRALSPQASRKYASVGGLHSQSSIYDKYLARASEPESVSTASASSSWESDKGDAKDPSGQRYLSPKQDKRAGSQRPPRSPQRRSPRSPYTGTSSNPLPAINSVGQTSAKGTSPRRPGHKQTRRSLEKVGSVESLLKYAGALVKPP